MSNQLAVIDKNQMPAFLAQAFQQPVDAPDAFTTGIKVNEYLPIISFRGKDFRIVVAKGDEKVVGRVLDVVLVDARPNVSKTFYNGPWGGVDNAGAPDCASADGIRPDPSISNPVSPLCQTCEKNVWGSKTSPSGKQAKACNDWKLIVVATPDLAHLFQMRIPATSLKTMAQYVDALKRGGVQYQTVVTRLGFTDAEFPQLTFSVAMDAQGIRWAATTEEQLEKLLSLKDTPEVKATLSVPKPAGLADTPQYSGAPVTHVAEQPVTIQQPAAPAAPAPAPEPEAAPADLSALMSSLKSSTDETPAPEAPAAPVAETAPAAKPDVQGILSKWKTK